MILLTNTQLSQLPLFAVRELRRLDAKIETETVSRNGAKARDKAIQKGIQHANVDWVVAVRQVVISIQVDTVFTMDEVWRRLAKYTVETGDHRAMGGTIQSLRDDGFIEPTNEWRVSNRPQNHRRPMRVWRRISCRVKLS